MLCTPPVSQQPHRRGFRLMLSNLQCSTTRCTQVGLTGRVNCRNVVRIPPVILDNEGGQPPGFSFGGLARMILLHSPSAFASASGCPTILQQVATHSYGVWQCRSASCLHPFVCDS
jgi:hypothetical protein